MAMCSRKSRRSKCRPQLHKPNRRPRRARLAPASPIDCSRLPRPSNRLRNARLVRWSSDRWTSRSHRCPCSSLGSSSFGRAEAGTILQRANRWRKWLAMHARLINPRRELTYSSQRTAISFSSAARRLRRRATTKTIPSPPSAPWHCRRAIATIVIERVRHALAAVTRRCTRNERRTIRLTSKNEPPRPRRSPTRADVG